MGAAGAIEIASGLVGPLKDAFTAAKFTPPNVTFTETETSRGPASAIRPRRQVAVSCQTLPCQFPVRCTPAQRLTAK